MSRMANSSAVTAVLNDLQKRDIVARIWGKDHTVWKPEPEEISHRLGWLTVTELMKKQIPALTSFADEIRKAGFRNVVLLGMGGASLGAEVLHQTLGNTNGYPEFTILDSTVPDRVQTVTEDIDLARTLFLVASKSGGTTETNCLYQYFRNLVAETREKEPAGENFVAITDAGTPLARLAEETKFRRTFLNPSDVGGRYSVLSFFGLLPAALMGINLKKLLRRADRMRQTCAPGAPVTDNPGVLLGAMIGASAEEGRDKLTLLTSPSIISFGLWLEQLFAESLGKEGKGIIPVVGEPLAEPEDYRDDRLFVYLRLEGDDNATLDAAVKKIKSSGKTVITLKWRDRYDLGAEFFRWEFATAVIGAILGINPFDQPDVQLAKDATNKVLHEYQTLGHLPEVAAAGSLKSLLTKAKKGDYFAIMLYICPTQEIEEALAILRGKIMKKYGVATTAGYGPRLLHSTGQLHKGGPDSGLFFQVTADYKRDLPIPGEPYTFAVLASAQALGDLRTLQSLNRRVARIHLGSGDGKAIRKLAEELE